MVDSKIRTIITGTTGMVGEGVLHECLLSSKVEAVWLSTAGYAAQHTRN